MSDCQKAIPEKTSSRPHRKRDVPKKGTAESTNKLATQRYIHTDIRRSSSLAEKLVEQPRRHRRPSDLFKGGRAYSQSPTRSSPQGAAHRIAQIPANQDKKPRRLSLTAAVTTDCKAPPSPSLVLKTRRFSRPDLYIKAKLCDLKEQRRDSRITPPPNFVFAAPGSYIEPSHLRIFVGTWNTECVSVGWRAFLTNPANAKSPRQMPPLNVIADALKIVPGNPIKSTFKSQVFNASTFHDAEMEEDSAGETLFWTTSSGEDSNSGVSMSSADGAVPPSSIDDAVGIRSTFRPSAHFRRSSSAAGIHTRYHKAGWKRGRRLYFRPNHHPSDQVSTHEIDPQGPLQDWIRAGYDIYLICVQECSTTALFDIIAAYCSKMNGQLYKCLDLETCKISGFGDGATFFPKSTAIACICRVDFIDRAWTVLDSYACSFNKLNASKGAVCLVAEAMQQRILFIGCHLTPAGPQARLRSRLEIRRRICNWLRIESFNDYFDHVIWSGDFNFRLREVNSRKAVQFLERHALRALLDFDEINDSVWSEDLASEKFCEPDVTFFPTYKKIKGRRPCDRTAPGWVTEEYAVRFKAQWYKGGRVKDRVPAWTDRIIKWSNDVATKSLMFIQGTYTAADGSDAENPIMDSDHSPVGVGMILGPLV
eukprot:Gregarina_sp_Poly_1__5377@NODE_283_length_10075_cov_114_472622_g245_i0_p1_GENE_NODE_283_length_10075_cov_114_472622_g245_i0NODE_283_length_10075_cov_114_472622_g245_i0_p1_ORF_typecomplete_len649_score71_30Exo_endo_phos/PF03372_23/0_00017_NODE_283_length_10075_cov_114_472622_g245_i011463092